MEKALKIQAEIKKVFGDNPVNLVGGSVRDIVLGREPKDWDYCTPLLPDDIEAMIRAVGRKPYLVGKKFGTVGFKVNVEGAWYYIEITTYRTEKYSKTSRKPEVAFIDDLDADLARRDFTINAMVLKEDGSIYDPYGGRLDILAKLIKTVGLPKDRITEDPLRMLRAARFASQLDFNIDPNMIGKMRQLGHTITIVSKERWVQELDKMLIGKKPARGLHALMLSDLMKYVAPEVWIALQEHEAFSTLSSGLEAAGDDVSLNQRWAMLFQYIGYVYAYKEDNKGRITFVNHDKIRHELLQGICARLKFSNDRRDALLLDKTIFNKSIDLQ